MEHFAHFSCDRCFSCAGIAGKDEVHGQLLHLSCTHSGPLLHEHALHGESAYGVLHRLHANEGVEFVEHLVEWACLCTLSHWQVFGFQLVHFLFLEESLAQSVAHHHARLAHHLHQSLALLFHCLVEDAPCLSCIAEVLVAPQIELLELALYGRLHIFGDGELLRVGHVDEYLGQLFGLVVVEMYGLREAALQSGVRVDEVVHLVGVAGNNADELASVVLQAFQQRVDGLAAERVVVARMQRVSLVDEEHASHSRVDELVGLDGRLSGKS